MTPLEYDRARIWHPYASLKNPPPVLHAKAASGLEIETAAEHHVAHLFRLTTYRLDDCRVVVAMRDTPPA